MAVQALVTRIKTRPIDGSDRIQFGACAGHQVIVSSTVQDGQLGIFFPPDSQLSEEFCYHNNLYRAGKGSNKDPDKSGYLEESRRIRTLKLRGVASDGIWMELESLAWTGVDTSTLLEGMIFNDINGKHIIGKYETPATRKARASHQAEAKTTDSAPGFKQHYETEQLKYFINAIPPKARLIITEKLHGTSGRTGHHLVRPALRPWMETINRWVPFLTLGIAPRWDHISGTRRTILTRKEGDGYHSGTFRQQIHERLSCLHKEETLYYEIVGWEGPGGSPIMATHHIGNSDPVRKELKKLYDVDRIVYSYGCQPGTFEVYVYRITHTNEDGVTIELSWEQIKARCAELGLKHVPELLVVRHTDADTLLELIKKLHDRTSTLDDTHPMEGVCIRVEDEAMFGKVFKDKSWVFKYLEGILKEVPDYVDIEESS